MAVWSLFLSAAVLLVLGVVGLAAADGDGAVVGCFGEGLEVAAADGDGDVAVAADVVVVVFVDDMLGEMVGVSGRLLSVAGRSQSRGAAPVDVLGAVRVERRVAFSSSLSS